MIGKSIHLVRRSRLEHHRWRFEALFDGLAECDVHLPIE